MFFFNAGKGKPFVFFLRILVFLSSPSSFGKLKRPPPPFPQVLRLPSELFSLETLYAGSLPYLSFVLPRFVFRLALKDRG